MPKLFLPSDAFSFGFCLSILCFEFVSGISLLTFMERNSSSMSLALAYYLGLDVINALEFLHAHGVSHNSIIPANILLVARSGVSGPSDPTVMTPLAFAYRATSGLS